MNGDETMIRGPEHGGRHHDRDRRDQVLIRVAVTVVGQANDFKNSAQKGAYWLISWALDKFQAVGSLPVARVQAENLGGIRAVSHSRDHQTSSSSSNSFGSRPRSSSRTAGSGLKKAAVPWLK